MKVKRLNRVKISGSVLHLSADIKVVMDEDQVESDESETKEKAAKSEMREAIVTVIEYVKIPATLTEALISNQKDEWKIAMLEEINDMNDRKIQLNLESQIYLIN